MVAYREDPVDSRGVIAHADCNGTSADIIDDPFGRRRRDSLDGRAGPGGACTDVSELLRGGEDEGPTFDGGDEDPLHDLGDADGLLGGTGGLGTGGVYRERQSVVGLELLYFFDDDLRWGKRRPEECCLNFLDGNDGISWLGDGEDLP